MAARKWDISLTKEDGIGMVRGLSDDGHRTDRKLTDDEVAMWDSGKQADLDLLNARLTVEFDATVIPVPAPPVVTKTTKTAAVDAAQAKALSDANPKPTPKP